MSDMPSHVPVKSIMPKWVRGPQDFVGGVALMAIALFALWASSDLQGMRGFSFGAGPAPRMFDQRPSRSKSCARRRRESTRLTPPQGKTCIAGSEARGDLWRSRIRP